MRVRVSVITTIASTTTTTTTTTTTKHKFKLQFNQLLIYLYWGTLLTPKQLLIVSDILLIL